MSWLQERQIDELYHRAVAAQAQGRHAEALGSLRRAESLLRAQTADDRVTSRLASLLYSMGSSLTATGEPKLAIKALEESERLYSALESHLGTDKPNLLADARARLAVAYAEHGSGASAVLKMEEAIGVYTALGAMQSRTASNPHYLDLARVLSLNASVLAKYGDPDLAAGSADRAVRMYLSQAEEINRLPDSRLHGMYLYRAITVAAETHAASGRFDLALTADDIAIAVKGMLGGDVVYEQARMGVHLEASGQIAKARVMLGQARQTNPAVATAAEQGFAGPHPVTLAAALQVAGENLHEILCDPRSQHANVCVADRCSPQAATLFAVRLARTALQIFPASPAAGSRVGLEAHFLFSLASRAGETNLRYRFGEYGPAWARVLLELVRVYHAGGHQGMARDLVGWSRGVLGNLQPYAHIDQDTEEIIQASLALHRRIGEPDLPTPGI
ncbi:hypothetical protein [Rhizohabitans arisaemae]|uniref:hypothetical protein n=1 Tax=Rhizohabitans arisaemae TaxID=2720610 RepID=UPI0024B11611|nr:hypothetical protein [Rhizohabitans arisaemae]